MLKKQQLAAMEGKHHDSKPRYSRKGRQPDEKKIGQCACGGNVYGVEEFGRVFSWCDACTPVRKVKI